MVEPVETVPGNRWDLLDGEPAPPTTVSIVVTHFEQPTQLARTLRALSNQTHPVELTEVLVVDDGSAVPPVVPPGVGLLRQDDHGFRAAAARNLGASRATGRVLVFLDADTTPEPDFVTRISRLPSLLPEALVVGRRRHADLSGSGVEHGEPEWLRRGYAETADLLHADETSCRFVISAVAACSAWLHRLVGGFDETFPAYGGEDWDWAHRVWNAGGLLAHEPGAVAWHDGPAHVGGVEDRPRLLAETLEIGRRIEVAGTAPVGLLLGGRDVVVRAGAEVAPEALALTLDSLLTGLTHARVQLTPGQAAALPALLDDPRITADAELEDDGFQRLVDLHRGVKGDADTWRAVVDHLRGVDAPGEVGLTADGVPLLTLTALRARRRETRWGRRDLFARRTTTQPGLEPLDRATTLQAHVGGWG